MKLRCRSWENAPPWFVEGNIYIALGLSYTAEHKYVYLENDYDEAGFADIRQFFVLSNYIPTRWGIQYKEKVENLSLFPKTWLEEKSFWEEFVDKRNPKMVELFNKEKKLIYQEEP